MWESLAQAALRSLFDFAKVELASLRPESALSEAGASAEAAGCMLLLGYWLLTCTMDATVHC